MEFHEKLQKLRRQRGLTQEELAAALYVSRAAISKWESGRGYPNLDSLKAIAKFYAVTIDDLLSGAEILTIAETDRAETKSSFQNLIFGLLDCSSALLLFLPFFGQKEGDAASAVSLLQLTGTAPWLRTVYFAAVAAMTLFGIVTLALQAGAPSFHPICRRRISLLFNTAAAFLFVISLQPYASVLLLVFLAIKILMLIKNQ